MRNIVFRRSTIHRSWGAVGLFAALAVLPGGGQAATCTPPPAALLSWWQAEGSPNDSVGTNNGALNPGTTYVAGEVGQAFSMNGAGAGVELGFPTNLEIQDFTLEAWVKRGSATTAGWDGYSHGLFISWAWGGYGFGLFDSGQLFLAKVGYSGISPSLAITDATSFHHVAVTKSGTNVVFYLDGVAEGVGAFDPDFVFNGTMCIGTRGSDHVTTFNGLVDEASVYSRALSGNEVLAIYNAGSAGKCATPIPPAINQQPTNQTVIAGQNITFVVGASGSQLLYYQWNFNGTPLPGETNSSLVINAVQLSQAGTYTVQVSNAANSVLSAQAVLTVNEPPPCAPPAAGLISWWRAEGEATDFLGANNGALNPGTSFVPGEVGQAFSMNAAGAGVELGFPTNLEIQNFTLETWVKRGSATAAGWDGFSHGLFISWAWGGYGFGLYNSGQLLLAKVGYSSVSPSLAITDATSFHHVVVTKAGTNVVFYLDGVAETVGAFDPGFVFNGTMCIGTRGSDHVTSFNGVVDEPAVYNRALSAAEVQAIYNAGIGGKCPVPIPPTISAQPADQVVTIGQSASFNVGVGGTAPLSYQWNYNGAPIVDATNASLVLTNIQSAQAGSYSVQITNAAGSVLSSNAVLTVVFPPAPVLVGSGAVPGGGVVTVPVLIVANGNENAFGFSLDFPPALLAYANVTLGTGVAGAALVTNTNQVGTGMLGILLSLATGTTLAPGTQELAEVSFVAAALTNDTAAQLTFGDQPTLREISDAQANPLPATYGAGSISIAAANFEGDVSPRPNGDKNVSVTDWVLEGRYVARLDYPTNANEYQRADCAPRNSLGDGAITVADWVQVGRYAAGLDPMTVAGGPTNDVGPNVVNLTTKPSPKGVIRQVRVANINLTQGQPGTVSVYLDAQGDENALGVTLAFDPTVLAFVSASPGLDAAGATLEINANQAAAGRVAFALASPVGTSFAAGPKEVLKLTLSPAPSAAGVYPVSLLDQPVVRQVVDATATALATTWSNGSVTVNPPPSLAAARGKQTITLSWPVWAANFTLQEADGSRLPSLTWSNVPAAITITNNQATVTVPLTSGTKFYRLQQ